MPILQNSRHEKFAQLVANGKPYVEAYEGAGYKSGSRNALSADSSALVRIPMVAARIAELKQRAEVKADISRAEVVAILGEYARGAGCPAEYSHEVRLKAIAQLTKMCGWDSAEKVELGADQSLIDTLKRLRGS